MISYFVPILFKYQRTVFHRVKSCRSSGKHFAVWGTVFPAMTPNITPWTLWSRAWPLSWTDCTLWTPSEDRTEGYTLSLSQLKEEILKCSSSSVTCQMMTQQLITSDCLLWVIGSSSRRNSNRQDAEPTRQTVTPGRRARVRQTKCSFLFRICHPPQHLYWLLNQIVPFNYTVLQREGMTECEARTLSDFGCGKTMFAGFFSRNGALTQQPRTGYCRLH